MRLFVAVNLPAAEKQRLTTVLSQLRRSQLPIRWVEDHSLHITLKFLGEADEQQLRDIAAAISRAAAQVAPFEIEIKGLGTFPPRGRPRVFWIGVDAPNALGELQNRLEQHLEPLGFSRENREFSPHITVGRVNADARSVDRVEMDRIARAFVYNAVVHVESIELMRSHLGPRGARYEMVERAPFGTHG